MLTSNVGEVERLAKLARIDRKTTTVLLEWMVKTLPTLAGLHALKQAGMGDPDASLLALLVALLRIPAAEAEHHARGVPGAVSAATWADVSVWCHHLRKRDGRRGLSLEAFEWLQDALSGRVFRIGSLQFERQDFTGPLHAFRHKTTSRLSAIAVPGTVFLHDRCFLAEDSEQGEWRAMGSLGAMQVNGHPVDFEHGQISTETLSLTVGDEWESVLSPGTPMLRLHIPADSHLSLEHFKQSTREAFHFFAEHWPEAPPPRGAFGEAWLLDPRVGELLPDPSSAAALRSFCHLYPGRIPEAKTVRRLFGTTATRASVISAPRAKMNFLQKGLAEFLEQPENHLCTRGAFVLREEL